MTSGHDDVIWHVRCRPGTTPDGHRRVVDPLGDYTPLVQPLPPEAALAQLRGAGRRLFGAAPGGLAARFRIQALAKHGVDTHIGIADTWATATTASAHVGRSGVLHLPDHRAVEEFLAPLPAAPEWSQPTACRSRPPPSMRSTGTCTTRSSCGPRSWT
ncbi:hypothetical protein DEJ45_04570 [Streptomyces venezuelae]|uniref:hypothetical protein n=1 Tax=Streptomyces venezuelae TaxID=54571 RepID=UPI00123D8FD6|nr:hypothetical protein [Streptomyces venezuelae]QES11749.1 hypothetical protein DEJ45_04570 [Streptomyces venezuelae]